MQDSLPIDALAPSSASTMVANDIMSKLVTMAAFGTDDMDDVTWYNDTVQSAGSDVGQPNVISVDYMESMGLIGLRIKDGSVFHVALSDGAVTHQHRTQLLAFVRVNQHILLQVAVSDTIYIIPCVVGLNNVPYLMNNCFVVRNGSYARYWSVNQGVDPLIHPNYQGDVVRIQLEGGLVGTTDKIYGLDYE